MENTHSKSFTCNPSSAIHHLRRIQVSFPSSLSHKRIRSQPFLMPIVKNSLVIQFKFFSSHLLLWIYFNNSHSLRFLLVLAVWNYRSKLHVCSQTIYEEDIPCQLKVGLARNFQSGILWFPQTICLSFHDLLSHYASSVLQKIEYSSFTSILIEIGICSSISWDINLPMLLTSYTNRYLTTITWQLSSLKTIK